MATYQKRGRAWRAIVRRAGITKTGTFDTKGEAVAWATKLEATLLAGETIDPVVNHDCRYDVTGSHILLRYAKEVSPGKRGFRWETIRLNKLAKYDIFRKPILSITGPDIAEWRDSRLENVSQSSVNRELCLISSVFTHAMREWRLGLTSNPCSQVTKPRKPRARTQRVSQEDRRKIIAELDWDGVSKPDTPPHWVAWAFYLALETAMRKGEILALKWGDINFEDRYAHLEMTKNGDARDVPLSKAALRLLQIPKRGGQSAALVPVRAGYFDVLFRAAKKRAGLDHIHFHDSRREAATTMAPKLANVLELAAITGHRSLSMLQVYYKPKPSDLAAKLD